jgi:hypothetical protein
MKHVRVMSDIPARAQGEGLCTNITGDLQARYCFVLAFFADVFVPLIQPFILVKASDGISDEVEGQL